MEKTLYKYGMRLRGRGFGCQPNGAIDYEVDESGKYYDIVIYDRQLTEEEIKRYELEDINKKNEEIEKDITD